MKSVAYIAGFIVGLLLVALIFFITKKIGDKKYGKSEKTSYDERQVAVRGKGYAIGFFVFAFCEILLMLIYALEIELPFSNIQIHTGVLFFTFAVFVVYCIWTDAYFKIGEKKGTWIIIMIFATGLNILAYVMQRIGNSTSAGSNLIISIFCVIVLLNVIAKSIADKKSAKND